MGDHECQAIADELYAFLDDALDLHMTLNVQAHLETCSTCFQRYQFVLNMRGLLREEAATFTAPVSLENRLRKLGRAQQRSSMWRRLLLKPVPLIAATVLLVLVLVAPALRIFGRADIVPSLVAHHRAILDAKVAMDLRTSNPQRITAWIEEQVPFPVNIPQASLEGYALVGATTIPLSNGSGMYVLYKRQAERLAYLVFPEGDVPIAAGKEALIGPYKLSLHRQAGYMIGIWQVDGRTYAMMVEDD